MYLGLRTGQVLSITLLLAVADIQLQRKWKGMRCRDFTATTQPQVRRYCSDTSLRNRTIIRNTEAMCILHLTPLHYSVVIALKQGLQVDLIWCDSLQRNGQQALYTYFQYYHFLEADMNAVISTEQALLLRTNNTHAQSYAQTMAQIVGFYHSCITKP